MSQGFECLVKILIGILFIFYFLLFIEVFSSIWHIFQGNVEDLIRVCLIVDDVEGKASLFHNNKVVNHSIHTHEFEFKVDTLSIIDEAIKDLNVVFMS